MLSLGREHFDLDAIRRDHPLPDVAGAVVPLKRAGNELKACCPFHSDRTPSFTIFDGGNRFHCFGCGAGGDVLDFVQRLHGVGLREAAAMLTGDEMPTVHVAPIPIDEGTDRVEEARAIWDAAQSIKGTLAETYLFNRAITMPLPDALRFALLPYGKRGPDHPCLVAAVSDCGGAVVGIQRTYLRPDGSGKADVAAPRLGLGKIAGGAVRLTPPAWSLILTEGVEDALSITQSIGKAAWAALGTSNLGKVQLPFSTEEVIIGADNDEAGKAAAYAAARAFDERGCRTKVIFPAAGFKDFNSELQEAR